MFGPVPYPFPNPPTPKPRPTATPTIGREYLSAQQLEAFNVHDETGCIFTPSEGHFGANLLKVNAGTGTELCRWMEEGQAQMVDAKEQALLDELLVNYND